MSIARTLRGHGKRAVSRALHRGWQVVRAAGTITADSPGLLRFGALGAESRFAFPLGAVFGERAIHIGTGTLVGEHASLSAGLVPGQELGSRPIVTIGDRCTIGRGSHIVGHQSIVIGDDVWTGPYVYITDQNHSYADPDRPIGLQWPINDVVEIGSGSWLGAGAIVLPGARLGRNVVVAAGSVVRGTVPDHSVVAGVPAKVVRRYDPTTGWHPPLRSLPAEIPEGITHAELEALIAQAESVAAGAGGAESVAAKAGGAESVAAGATGAESVAAKTAGAESVAAKAGGAESVAAKTAGAESVAASPPGPESVAAQAPDRDHDPAE
ncbi:acyltransferase [Yinghuangia sp. ASG 101]|uniref:acyltransferase n=1 Tax=Yinghuangia sp. ASG 101 TaxID=2896848 RepID=UPI001E3DDC84|nr:acyltransferase [Yinghuangia sp. ASG 101]UGQ09296.1 acyltransferase [Yinghuangia sp. ASG 101]